MRATTGRRIFLKDSSFDLSLLVIQAGKIKGPLIDTCNQTDAHTIRQSSNTHTRITYNSRNSHRGTQTREIIERAYRTAHSIVKKQIYNYDHAHDRNNEM